jgi:cyclophilin family peptidyl-prolyl cis-trans isomerase
LAGLGKLLRAENDTWQGPDSMRTRAAALLRQSFDSPDIRVRLEGRQTGLATGLLPENLIPTEASLRATLPAVARAQLQPPVAVPFTAPKVLCVTPRGEFVIQLDGKIAPNTCAVFLDLIGKGYFADLTFHRVVPDFVVQGGDPRGDGWGGPGYTIRSEWSRARFERAVVGIAHDGKDTGGSQFFVTLSEQPHLNGRYTVFGEVTEGMQVVDRIELGDRFGLEIMP